MVDMLRCPSLTKLPVIVRDVIKETIALTVGQAVFIFLCRRFCDCVVRGTSSYFVDNVLIAEVFTGDGAFVNIQCCKDGATNKSNMDNSAEASRVTCHGLIF